MSCDTLDTLQGPIIHQSNLLVSQAFFHTSKPQSGCQASRSQKRSKECKTHVLSRLSRQRSYTYIYIRTIFRKIYGNTKIMWYLETSHNSMSPQFECSNHKYRYKHPWSVKNLEKVKSEKQFFTGQAHPLQSRIQQICWSIPSKCAWS